MDGTPPRYLDPQIPMGLEWITMPVVVANDRSLKGYGELLAAPQGRSIEIVRWPPSGWRPVDSDSGDQGGIKEGVFQATWAGQVLLGSNQAVRGEYVLGFECEPSFADRKLSVRPKQVLLWHANYHPDGGQSFFPRSPVPFLVPLALPGDDVLPHHFVAFLFDGTKGLYIHPNVWHEGIFPLDQEVQCDDRQGAVHARVSVEFPREFGCLLRIDLEDARRLLESTNHP